MNQPTQLHLIFALDKLRSAICAENDLLVIISKAEEAYALAEPISIDPSFGYKIEGKARTMQMLQQEIRLFRKSNSEIEVIRFQLSSTILMLMLQFAGGSLNNMQHAEMPAAEVA